MWWSTLRISWSCEWLHCGPTGGGLATPGAVVLQCRAVGLTFHSDPQNHAFSPPLDRSKQSPKAGHTKDTASGQYFQIPKGPPSFFAQRPACPTTNHQASRPAKMLFLWVVHELRLVYALPLVGSGRSLVKGGGIEMDSNGNVAVVFVKVAVTGIFPLIPLFAEGNNGFGVAEQSPQLQRVDGICLLRCNLWVDGAFVLKCMPRSCLCTVCWIGAATPFFGSRFWLLRYPPPPLRENTSSTFIPPPPPPGGPLTSVLS